MEQILFPFVVLIILALIIVFTKIYMNVSSFIGELFMNFFEKLRSKLKR